MYMLKCMGFLKNTPKVTFNHLPGVLKGTETITSLSGRIVNGTKYKFFMPLKTPESVSSWSDLDFYGTIRIFDGVKLKREFTIY